MAGEKDLLHRSAGEAFFRHGGAAGAEQVGASLTALVQFPGEPRRRNLELRRCGIVHKEEAALFVLNRDGGREHSEYISQKTHPDISRKFGLFWCASVLRGVVCAVLHDRR